MGAKPVDVRVTLFSTRVTRSGPEPYNYLGNPFRPYLSYNGYNRIIKSPIGHYGGDVQRAMNLEGRSVSTSPIAVSENGTEKWERFAADRKCNFDIWPARHNFSAVRVFTSANGPTAQKARPHSDSCSPSLEVVRCSKAVFPTTRFEKK